VYGNPSVADCDFTGNTASGDLNRGGGIDILESTATISNCHFAVNTAMSGGGLNAQGFVGNVYNCTFTINNATYGGGISVGACSASVIDCTFTGNCGNYGGGLYAQNGITLVGNCTFTDNSSYDGGGGIRAAYGNPIVYSCEFIGNTASGDNGFGGGMEIFESTATVSDCQFDTNSAKYGGGLYAQESPSSVISNCSFTSNQATYGGGLRVFGNGTRIVCSLFSGNSAYHGGALHYWDASQRVHNCTFSQNSADVGGCAWASGTSEVRFYNCIIWDNAGGQLVGELGPTSLWVCRSIIQGGWSWPPGGCDRIDADPLFIDPDTGDFRLNPGSPGIDAGDNTLVPVDTADLDGDGNTTERTPLDLDGASRFVNDPATVDTGVADPPDYMDIVDMGAYEFQVDVCLADLTGDSVVNIDDIFAVLGLWGTCPDPCPPYCTGDLTDDCLVNIDDIFAILGQWGPCE